MICGDITNKDVYNQIIEEAKQSDDEVQGNDIRLAFELKFSRRQFTNYQPINTHKMINYTFIDTTFDKLEECVVNG